MNSLSLVIYLADVLPGLRGGFSFLMVMTFLISIGVTVLLFCLNRSTIRAWIKDRDEKGRCGYHDVQYMEAHKPLPTHLGITGVVVSSIICLFLLFIPSKETILLMAGSEFSEQVVNTPEAKELLEGVRQVIKSQLEQYTKKE